jgi:hypothetical protein
VTFVPCLVRPDLSVRQRISDRCDPAYPSGSLPRARNFHRPTRSVRIWSEDAGGSPSSGVSFKLSSISFRHMSLHTYDRKELIE